MSQRATEKQFQIKRRTRLYVCPKCGEHGEAPQMWVPVEMHCDGCGTEMTESSIECPLCLAQVRSAELYCHKCEES